MMSVQVKKSLLCFFRHAIRILWLVSLFPAGPVHGQKKDSSICQAGVFISQDDFIHNRLSYKINTAAEGYKLDFSFPADLTLTLKIITPDTTFKFIPGNIYGYTECGSVYRYFEGGEELNAQEDFYMIEEAAGLILYSSQFISGNEIFYSMGLTSPIHRLTLRNLKIDFGNYPEFIAEAKKLKRQPDGLSTRDEKGFIILKLFEEQSGRISNNE